MAIAESVSNAQNLLKVLYPGEVSVPSYEKSAAIGLMKKDTNFVGTGIKYVVVSIAPGAGGAANFETALANQGPTQEVKFALPRKKLYELGSIDGEALQAGKGDKGSIIELLKHQMNRSRYGFARSEAACVWGNGGGSRGVISAISNLASPTITLTNRNDGAKFFKGMWLQVSATDGSSSTAQQSDLLSGGLQAQIINVTRSSSGVSTVTIDRNWNAFGGIAVGNFIFRSGDYASFPTGIPGWAPVADPGGADLFCGVNRSTAGDVNYLSGFRVDGNGQAKAQTLIDAGAEAHQNGLSITTFFVSPLDLKDAMKEQSTYKTIPVGTDQPTVGYDGIKLLTAVGSMTSIGETDVPRGFAWGIDPSTWTRRSLGDVPFLVNADGILNFLRSPTADAFQYRLAAYFAYENSDPSQAVIVKF